MWQTREEGETGGRKCQRGKWWRLKENGGVKKRGMERRCDSQWGWMVEEAEERVKARWKQPKQGDEQDSHHSCFLFKIPSRCAPHLSPELNAGWLTHYYRSVWTRPLRGSLFCWGTCTWNQVMRADVWWSDWNGAVWRQKKILQNKSTFGSKTTHKTTAKPKRYSKSHLSSHLSC